MSIAFRGKPPRAVVSEPKPGSSSTMGLGYSASSSRGSGLLIAFSHKRWLDPTSFAQEMNQRRRGLADRGELLRIDRPGAGKEERDLVGQEDGLEHSGVDVVG